MSEWKAKRFWTEATVEKAEGGFGVLLDGRGVKTPAKAVLSVPTRSFARAIASEWDAQTDQIDPNTMPFTRTANAAIDKVSVQHGEVAQMLADYGDSDLLCYRADHPDALIQRQDAAWDPLLDWAAESLNVRLAPRRGIMHAPQTEDALAIIRSLTHALSSFELAAFHDLVSLSGSWVLGYAALDKAHSVEDLWNWSRIDEDWQAEQWGRDEEADAQAAIKKAAFLHANAVIDALRAE